MTPLVTGVDSAAPAGRDGLETLIDASATAALAGAGLDDGPDRGAAGGFAGSGPACRAGPTPQLVGPVIAARAPGVDMPTACPASGRERGPAMVEENTQPKTVVLRNVPGAPGGR